MLSQKEYRLVALDMDGTLLNDDHQTTPYTREVLKRVSEMGKYATLSTGRCLSELREHIEEIPGIRYIICENGGCVYDAKEDKYIRNLLINDEDADLVLKLSYDYDLTRQYFVGNQSYVECTDEENFKRHHMYYFAPVFRKGSIYIEDMMEHYRNYRGKAEKINLYFATKEDRQDFKNRIAGKTDMPMADSIGIGLEIVPAGATKGTGLAHLCRHLNIPIEESIAVGDGGNDVEIMQTAGLAVAMKNAIEEVKAIADIITDDNNHDGAAKAVQKYMIG